MNTHRLNRREMELNAVELQLLKHKEKSRELMIYFESENSRLEELVRKQDRFLELLEKDSKGSRRMDQTPHSSSTTSSASSSLDPSSVVSSSSFASCETGITPFWSSGTTSSYDDHPGSESSTSSSFSHENGSIRRLRMIHSPQHGHDMAHSTASRGCHYTSDSSQRLENRRRSARKSENKVRKLLHHAREKLADDSFYESEATEMSF